MSNAIEKNGKYPVSSIDKIPAADHSVSTFYGMDVLSNIATFNSPRPNVPPIPISKNNLQSKIAHACLARLCLSL